MNAREGDGLGEVLGGGAGGSAVLCDRKKRKQESGGYRGELHRDVVECYVVKSLGFPVDIGRVDAVKALQ